MALFGLYEGEYDVQDISLPDTPYRCLDLVLVVGLIIVAAPVLCLLAVMIHIADGGPILFVQQRVGRNGKLFPCLKFRTMHSGAEGRLNSLLAADPVARAQWQARQKLDCDPRVTALGSLLRRLSLDELPQLLNVLRGDMSLVGPRPIVPAEIDRYGEYFLVYCAVRPGVSGLWQVSGRSDLDYRRRIELDVAYVQNRSLGAYVWVLLMTLPAVVKSRGAQ